MKHIGLFAGGGGFEYVIQKNGGQTVAFSEIDPFCIKVLKHHFPGAKSLGTIDTINFKEYANTIDIITGGFPCQPFSVSGERKGESDPRYKWPEMLRAIQTVRPPYVVAENVYGILNWSKGMVFEKVQTDLESEGYEVLSFVLPAASVGANHERKRVWFIAFNRQFKMERQRSMGESYFANPNCHGWTELRLDLQKRKSKVNGVKSLDQSHFQSEIPTFPPLCSMDDGIPRNMDGISFSNWRGESVKMYGNSIHTGVFENIYKTILEMDEIFNQQ